MQHDAPEWDLADQNYVIQKSQISPDQADSIVLKPSDDTSDMPGYRCVSAMELRELYGLFINHNNLHMPMVQYLSMILDIVRTNSLRSFALK